MWNDDYEEDDDDDDDDAFYYDDDDVDYEDGDCNGDCGDYFVSRKLSPISP